MAGKTSGVERDARRILAEVGVAAIDDLRGQVAALEARLAEVERERDAALAGLDAPETCDHCGEPCVDYRQRDGERWCIGCVSVEADARIAEYRALRDRAFADEAEVDAALGAAGVPLGENPPDGAVGLRCYSRAERIRMLANERDAAVARLREIEAGAPAVRELRDAAVALADMVEEAAREDVPGILGERALRAEERLAALTQAAGEAAETLDALIYWHDCGDIDRSWWEDAREKLATLRAAMGETK